MDRTTGHWKLQQCETYVDLLLAKVFEIPI